MTNGALPTFRNPLKVPSYKGEKSMLAGIIPAVVTPFDAEGKFNVRSFERLAERLYEAGVHGLYLCGSTGEGMLQTVAQRKQVAEAAMRNSPPNKSVIIHVGANTTGEA